MYNLKDFVEYTDQKLNGIVLTWCKADGYMFRSVDEIGDRKVIAVES